MTRVAPQSSVVKTLEAENQALQTRFSSLLEHHTTLDQSLCGTIEDLSKTKEECFVLQADNVSLCTQLSSAQAIEAENQALQAENESLRAQLSSVEEKNAVLEADTKSLNRTMTDLKNHLNDLRDDNEFLRRHISAMKEKEKEQGKLDEIEKMNEGLQKELEQLKEKARKDMVQTRVTLKALAELAELLGLPKLYAGEKKLEEVQTLEKNLKEPLKKKEAERVKPHQMKESLMEAEQSMVAEATKTNEEETAPITPRK